MDMANRVLGFDAYHGDGELQYHELQSAGVRFTWSKATQGMNIVDPLYNLNRQRASAVGILHGGYHFFDPGVDPVFQARFFVGTIKPVKGDLLPVIDAETFSGTVAKSVVACMEEVKSLIGRMPIIYASDYFFMTYLARTMPPDTAKWIARYGGNEPETAWQFWQFSEEYQLAGYTLDADVFNGSEADLQKYTL